MVQIILKQINLTINLLIKQEEVNLIDAFNLINIKQNHLKKEIFYIV